MSVKRWAASVSGVAMFAVVAAISVGAVSIDPAPARSDDMKEVCATSFENAQKMKREGHLKEARKELLVCAGQSCPDVVVPQCVKWLKDVDETMPSIVVVAHGPKGDTPSNVKVSIDGEVVASSLDGRSIPVDPGKHHMRYELEGSPAVEEDLLLSVGDQNKRVEPTFKAPGGTAEAPGGELPKAGGDDKPTSAPVRWPAYLAIGVGGAGLVVGAITGGLALGAKSSLDDACTTKTTCPPSAQSDIDTLGTMSIVSTVGFVAGGVIAATGIIVAIALPRGSSTSKETKAALVLPWIAPLDGHGYAAGLSGAF
jgi:hypothetical protein